MPELKHHTVTATRHTSAPQAAVRDLLADSATWPDWSPVRVMTVERRAPDGCDGVGAIRSLKTSLATSREEVLEMEAPERFRYRMLSGLPLTDYVGIVTTTRDDGGTTITWSATFSTPAGLRGWFWHRFIKAALTSYCGGLARHAARHSTHDVAATPSVEPSQREQATPSP